MSDRLKDLVSQLRTIAARGGSMHGWWDSIIDMELFLEGRPTWLGYTHDEWVKYAEELLGDRIQGKVNKDDGATTE